MTWRHGKTFWTWVRLRDGSRIRRSLEASDKSTAREIEGMLGSLHAVPLDLYPEVGHIRVGGSGFPGLPPGG